MENRSPGEHFSAYLLFCYGLVWDPFIWDPIYKLGPLYFTRHTLLWDPSPVVGFMGPYPGVIRGVWTGHEGEAVGFLSELRQKIGEFYFLLD